MVVGLGAGTGAGTGLTAVPLRRWFDAVSFVCLLIGLGFTPPASAIFAVGFLSRFNSVPSPIGPRRVHNHTRITRTRNINIQTTPIKRHTPRCWGGGGGPGGGITTGRGVDSEGMGSRPAMRRDFRGWDMTRQQQKNFVWFHTITCPHHRIWPPPRACGSGCCVEL